MDIKTLNTFVTVARLKNFSAAARELHTVQPTVSRHISDLENELEAKLFDRTTHQVELTPSGARLLPEALKILENDKRVKSLIRQTVVEEASELKIGYLATACTFFLPEILQRFRVQHNNVNAHLYEMTPAQQAMAINESKVDIIFTRESIPIDEKIFASQLIYLDSLVAVLPVNHPLAEKEELDINDLEAERLHLFHRNEWLGVYENIVKMCNENGFSPNIVSNPMNMRHLVTSVSSGLGISVAPRCIKFIAGDTCVCRPIKQISTQLSLMMYYRKNSQNKLITRFVDHCLDNSHEIQALISE
ncbi:LysR substrate-binding domain-containing protein [Vibrio sp. FNV 38]|nr:LysR substrate-binding domain-containing protein [Vibrio sp. FNV 38]